MLNRIVSVAVVLCFAGCSGTSDYEVTEDPGPGATGGTGYVVNPPPHTGGAPSTSKSVPVATGGFTSQSWGTGGLAAAQGGTVNVGAGGTFSKGFGGSDGLHWVTGGASAGGETTWNPHAEGGSGVIFIGSQADSPCMLDEHCPEGFVCSMTGGDPELAKMGVGHCAASKG